MALEWLGQLSPTMQQQIALQRALLALQREDEQIRAKTPALARGLEGGRDRGAAPTAYAGPTPTLAKEKEPAAVAPSYFRPGAGGLEEALRAAQPSPGYVSGEERARLYREKMAAGKEELVGKASEFWARIEPLDDAGEKVALDACRKHQPELYRAMIEQGYVDRTTGTAVKPEVVKKPMTRDTHVEDGWLYEDVLYDDGTSTHTIIGRADEVEAEAPTITEAIGLEKLGMEQVEFAERHRADIIKVLGDMPRIGIDTVTEDGKEIPVDQRHVNAWLEGYGLLNALFSARAGEVAPEGEPTMSEAQREFEGSSGEVKMAIQQKLGVTQTGEWDEATEFAFSTYGDILLGEKPAEEEAEPRFERQRTFWDTWFKKWGKVIKGTKSAVEVLKGYAIK